MKTLKAPLFALLLCLPLAACGERPQADDPLVEAGIGQKVREATNRARKEITEKNISISSDGGAKVEISPAGDLLIDGRKVAANAQQQALLKEYRGNIEQIALAGMDVGVAGADLGMKAATEAIGAVFSGKGDQVEQRMEAEAKQIEAAALTLCGHLPAMLDTQTRLAAAMPEFRPYATLDQSDVDDCNRDGGTTAEQVRAQVREDIRREIRGGVRDAVRGAAQAAGVARSDSAGGQDAAAEAEAASDAEPATR